MKTRTIATCISIPIIAGAAFTMAPMAGAQQDARSGDQDKRTASKQNADQTSAAYRKADNTIGIEVVNNRDEVLGEISDILLDRDTGESKYALISTGGVMGMGDTVRAVPGRALNWDNRDERFVLRIDQDQFENLPEFDERDWSTLKHSGWRRSIERLFGVDFSENMDSDDAVHRDRDRDPHRDAMRDRRDRDGKSDRNRMTRDRDKERDRDPKQRFVLAGGVEGREILGSGGNELAETKAILLDARQRRPAFVTAAAGGVLGIGETTFALPWRALHFDDQDRLHLRMSEDDLKAAPTLNDREIAALNDRSFRNRLYSHFGIDSRKAERDANYKDGDSMKQKDDEYSKLFRNGREVTISGRIEERTEKDMASRDGKIVVITIRDSSDNLHKVHLLTASDMKRRDIALDRRTNVQVIGRQVEIDRETFVIAERMKVGDKTATLRNRTGEMASR